LDQVVENDIERIYRLVEKKRRAQKPEEPNVAAEKELIRRERYEYLQKKLYSQM